MAGIADLIFSLSGKPDPRQQLMDAMGGSTSATPTAPQAAPVGAVAGGGTTAPAGVGTPPQDAPPQPKAMTSPPDLMSLYTDLANYQKKSDSFERGMGLVGAAFAHPENRASIINSFGGGSGGGGSSGQDGMDPMSLISNITKMRESQDALQRQAALRASIPSIAKQYGLTEETANYLFESGKLDAVIQEAQKPNKEIVTQSDGTFRIVDKNDGSMTDAFGVPKKRPMQIVADDQGNQFAVYTDTGQRVGGNIVDGQGSTGDERLWRADEADRVSRGLPSRSLSDFLATNNKSKATTINTGSTGIDYGTPPKDMAWKRDPQGNVIADENGAPQAVVIKGSAMATKAEDEAKMAKDRAASKFVTSSIVNTDIDRALERINNSKDNTFDNATGPVAAVGQYVPIGEAYNTKALLETVKANIGFDKLQAMREASPTGGALGQVSDFENKLLQSVYGNLELSQDREQITYNLRRVKAVYNAIITKGIPDQAAADAVLNSVQKDAPKTSVDDLVEKYGAPDGNN